MAHLFFRSMIAYLMIHIIWFKGQWSKLYYVQYVLMEMAYYHMYGWFQGCMIYQATLLTLLLHSLIHYYTNHVLILKKQESLSEYYSYVVMDLVWLCMKNEYMSFETRILLTLYLLWMERLKNSFSGENQAVVKVAAEAAADGAAADEAAADEEDYDEEEEDYDEEEEEEEEDDDQENQENLVNQ
jgi:hypothetical protein